VSVAAPCSGLSVDLDVFSGPFDLLVTLILREEVDLWEVKVSQLIADYVVHLADTGEFDLETTSQFLVYIATLLEMKSRLLLSLPNADDDEEDDGIDATTAREELLAALVRYTQYKAASLALGERWLQNSGRIARQAPPPLQLTLWPLEQQLPPQALVQALAPLLQDPPMPDASHITDVAVTLVQELRRLRDLLERDGEFTFASVAPAGKLERAITFFALLELHSRGEVRLRQSRPFAEITVTPAGAGLAAASQAG
jgi:segregation and condensation protein A